MGKFWIGLASPEHPYEFMQLKQIDNKSSKNLVSTGKIEQGGPVENKI
jgi:hypothetical protein